MRNLLVAAIVVSLSACGDDDTSVVVDAAADTSVADARSGDGASGDGSAPMNDAAADGARDAAGASSGTLTVTASNIVGAQGKVLVVFVSPEGGSPMSAALGICAQLATDPASVTDTVKARTSMGSPCDLEATPASLMNGRYTVDLRVFQGGSMTAEQCASTTVTVAGDTELTAPSLGSCTP